MKLFIKQGFEPEAGGNVKLVYDALEIIPQAGAIIESNDGLRMIVPFENILALQEPTFDDDVDVTD